jgi:predicted Holliday junction resolvase-like endonuclease
MINLNDIATIFAIGLTAIMIYKGFFESRNLKRQGESLMANMINQYESTLKETVDRANKATLEATKYADEIADLKRQMSRQARQVKQLIADRDDLKDWAERLCAQVVELHGVPVKMRQRKGGESEVDQMSSPKTE